MGVKSSPALSRVASAEPVIMTMPDGTIVATQAFKPLDRSTLAIPASSTTNTLAILNQPSHPHQLRLFNGTTVLAFYRLGDGSAAATTADLPLPPGAIEVVTVDPTAAAPETNIAVILASGSGLIHASTGAGI